MQSEPESTGDEPDEPEDYGGKWVAEVEIDEPEDYGGKWEDD